MLAQLILGALLTVGAVLRRRRNRRRNRIQHLSDAEDITDPIALEWGLNCSDLQQVLAVAMGNPRLLLTSGWQTRVHNIARRITESTGSLPWQLTYVYRQMESIVDTLSYDELYEFFGGHPTPPAVTRDQIKVLETSEFDADACEADAQRSDRAACPICLEPYVRGERIMTLPSCKHVFHAPCVVRGDCPICRAPIKAQIEGGITEKASCPFSSQVQGVEQI